MRGQKVPYEVNHRININGDIEKRCNKCKEWKLCTEEFFYKNDKNNIDGLFPYCKECNIKNSDVWIKNNPEKFKKSYKKYMKTDSWKRYKKKNNEDTKDIMKQWRQDNPDIIKQYNEKHMMNKTHTISNTEWKDCKNYFNNSCAYCGISEIEAKEKYKQNLHKEHIINDGANNLSNCVPACKQCNSEKWKSELDQWYNENNSKYTKERYNKITKWIKEDYKNFIQEKPNQI